MNDFSEDPKDAEVVPLRLKVLGDWMGKEYHILTSLSSMKRSSITSRPSIRSTASAAAGTHFPEELVSQKQLKM